MHTTRKPLSGNAHHSKVKGMHSSRQQNPSSIIFEFSTEVIRKVIEELDKAEEFIKIAIFQLHHMDIFNILLRKIRQGVSVEIFTLPYDSIYEIYVPR